MPPKRRKAPAQQAPQTIEEASFLLGRYVGRNTEVEKLRADADAAIAAIQAARDAAIAPIEQAAKDDFRQLHVWWSVAGPDLTEGKRKSIELAGCVIGERTTPPSLKMPGKVDEAAALLVAAGWIDDLCRQKIEVDKPAVLKALGHDVMGPQLTALGFSSKQKDEFFIDRAAPKPEAVEEVSVEEAA